MGGWAETTAVGKSHLSQPACDTVMLKCSWHGIHLSQRIEPQIVEMM